MTVVEMNPHQVLGVDLDATTEQVRARYLELVRQFPPDRHPDRFHEIHSAYQSINDPLIQAGRILRLPTDKPDLNSLIDTSSKPRAVLPKLSLLGLGNDRADCDRLDKK